jgi:hypothetical protein
MPRTPKAAEPIKSVREDGRGHWPAGKHRSTLTAHQRATVIRQLRKLVESQESIRGAARLLKVSDRSIRRIFSGEDQPSEAIQQKLRAQS